MPLGLGASNDCDNELEIGVDKEELKKGGTGVLPVSAEDLGHDEADVNDIAGFASGLGLTEKAS